jgi:nicotinate-nucleotide adenylyltransferase
MCSPIIPSSNPARSGLRIGILGGSFNPAHEGHFAISMFAIKRLGLNQVWWLVSPQNPLKSTKDMRSLTRRLATAHRIARSPKIIVTDLERQIGTRYTVDTLQALRRRFPRVQFVWLMGADNLQQLPAWHKWADLFRMVPIAVFRRPGYAIGRRLGKAAQRFDFAWLPPGQSKNLARHILPAWLVLDNRLNYLSATEIRHQNEKD